MRIVKRIGIFFCLPLSCFVAGMLFEKTVNLFYPGKQSKDIYEIDETNKIDEIDRLEEKVNIADSTPAGIIKEEMIGADTDYIIYEHDLNNDTSVETKLAVPVKYIGMDRQKFLDEMAVYQFSPSLADLKKGFVSLDVLLFSSDEIVIQKNYIYEPKENHFYMLAENNLLKVYYEDMITLFISTEITLESLPEDVQVEIMQGKYFETEEELYNYLESYSS